MFDANVQPEKPIAIAIVARVAVAAAVAVAAGVSILLHIIA
jgi:hypothetical protein